MDIKIRKYDNPLDYENLLELISSEGEDWQEYLKPEYRMLLDQSITYIARSSGTLCGYVRSIKDGGILIWVIDLLVHKNYRGHSIGMKLLDRLRSDYPDPDIYVMSDVDEYYEKLGYEKVGSIFKIV